MQVNPPPSSYRTAPTWLDRWVGNWFGTERADHAAFKHFRTFGVFSYADYTLGMVGVVMTPSKSAVAFSMKGNLGPGKLLRLDFVGGICGLGRTPWVLRHLSTLSILSSQSLIGLECCDIPGQFLDSLCTRRYLVCCWRFHC